MAMKTWKLSTGLLSVVVVGASTVVQGCGTASTSSSGSKDTSSSSGGVVQLTYWNMWSGKWEQVVQKMVDQFNATHPNIHVNMLAVPSASGDQKLLTAIAAGDPPDVFTEWNASIGEFAAKGAVMNLDQFMTGKYAGLKNWFYPSVTQFGTYNGKLYAMPWTENTYALYYNKTMMKQAGLNPNDPPTTLAQLFTVQNKEWKFGNGGVVTQMGFYPSGNFEHLMPAFGLSGSDLFTNGKYNLLNTKAENDMSYIAQFKKYPYSQVSAFTSGLDSAGGGSTDAFDIGKEGFTISGMWEMGQIQADDPSLSYGVEPLPVGPGGNANSTWINGNYNMIPSGSKHPEQAFEFISWLAGYENAAWAAEAYPTGGWVPNSPEITKQPAYQKWLSQDPVRKQFVNVLNSPKSTTDPVTPAAMLYETQLTNAEDYVLQGKKSVTQALSDLQNQANQELQNDAK